MNDKMNDLVIGVAALLELGCIVGLAGIGLKRNSDCYKAEVKLIEAEHKLAVTECNNIVKDAEIAKLRDAVDILKAQIKGES